MAIKRILAVVGLALVLVMAACGTPGKAAIGNTPPPVQPPPPLVVDLSAGTWTVTQYDSSGAFVGDLTLNLVKNGNCPSVAPGTTFAPKTCYQAAAQWPGTFQAVGGCYLPQEILVGQDASNNVQFQVLEAGATELFTLQGVGSITSATASGGTYVAPCGSTTVSGTWTGYLPN